MPKQSRSLLERAFGACLGFLAGAVAIYVAVHLIEAVLPALLVIGGVGTVIAIGVAIIRARNRGW